jgi:hypothetical protein
VGRRRPQWRDRRQPDSQVLLRFDFITDLGAGNLPTGAQVDKAELRLHTSELTDSQSPNTISMYRLLKPWTVNGTWNSQTDGISNDGLDAILGANDSFVPDVQGEFITLDVTESLAAWLAGAPNYGWAFFPGGGMAGSLTPRTTRRRRFARSSPSTTPSSPSPPSASPLRWARSP